MCHCVEFESSFSPSAVYELDRTPYVNKDRAPTRFMDD